MSPRAGGEASKVGQRYEMDWTVRQLIGVLSGQLTSVTVEDVGEIQTGSEFTALRADGTVELHQVKRSAGAGATWTPKRLQDEGVFAAARQHAAQDRKLRVAAARQHAAQDRKLRFISTTPAPMVSDLAVAAARDKADLPRFRRSLTKDQKVEFDAIAKGLDSEQSVLAALSILSFEQVGETELAEGNAILASALYDVPSHVSTFGDVLVGIVQDRLGHRLTRERLDEELARRGFHRLEAGRATTVDAARECTIRWTDSVQRELLQPPIDRQEVADVLAALAEENARIVVTGTAGSGKSAVLLGVVRALQVQDWSVLALRLDWLAALSHAHGVGQELGLDRSPVASLAALAGGAPSVLVIDQVDALSSLAGRSRTGLDVLGELLVQASYFQNMRVLLSCRSFDAQHDISLRKLVIQPGGAHVDVPPLDPAQVTQAVESMGVPAPASPAQVQLLSSPLNLVLLSELGTEVTSAWSSRTQLLDAFWDHKRGQHVGRGGTAAGFAQALFAVAQTMSERAELTVPVAVADETGLTAEIDLLVSGDVLRRNGQQLSFFHETFFDYTFARHWSTRDQSLRAFLVHGEQELFRRAQVRQVLVHLREIGGARWLHEVEDLLTAPEIRFHLKAVVLAVLRSLVEPTAAELDMLERVCAAPSTAGFSEHLDTVLRSTGWFDRLHGDGHLQRWLVSDDTTVQGRATDVLRSNVHERPDEVAHLLTEAAATIDTGPLLSDVMRIGDVGSSRPLFELLLTALTAGALSSPRQTYWLPLHDLGKTHPDWAAEAVAHYLGHRPGAWTLTEDNRIDGWRYQDHWADEVIGGAAKGAPAAYCHKVLPLLLYAAHLTVRDDGSGQIRDGHFSRRLPGGAGGDLDDALADGAAVALRQLTIFDRAAAWPWFQRLAVSELDLAQWLLYDAIVAASEVGDHTLSQWAATLLLEGPHRFLSSAGGDSFFHAGQVLAAISPHVDDDTFQQLEAAVLGFAAPWDQRRAGGTQFRLLWSLDHSRLSDQGRRRLNELRRKYGEQPAEPPGVMGGTVDSPVPAAATEHMSDDNWLDAIGKHSEDKTDWNTGRGGAHELGQLLRIEVSKHPARFARLALRLDATSHPAYTVAVLMGLGQTEEPVDGALVFDVIRHIAALHRDDDKRWIGWALRPHYTKDVPADIIDLLLDTALHAADPAPDDLHWADKDTDSRGVASALMGAAMNSARGAATETLGDLLIHDEDGSRTAQIAPAGAQLAADRAVPVRAAAAHLLATCLRHAPHVTEAAFPVLIDTDDRLLATRTAQDLIAYLSRRSVDHVEEVLLRMIGSEHSDVREAGGRLLTFVGLERERPDLLDAVGQSQDPKVRRGAATICAHRLPITSQRKAAQRLLVPLFHDPDGGVVDAAAEVAGALRGEPLRDFQDVLRALLNSPALTDALPQLFITLEQAPDALNDLTLDAVAAVLTTHREAVGDVSTSISADAHHGFELVTRVLHQAHDTDTRRKALDLIDELILLRVYTPPRWFDEYDR